MLLMTKIKVRQISTYAVSKAEITPRVSDSFAPFRMAQTFTLFPQKRDSRLKRCGLVYSPIAIAAITGLGSLTLKTDELCHPKCQATKSESPVRPFSYLQL
jgi:hypothetical protein